MIGAVGESSDAPVADEGYRLARIGGSNLRTKGFGLVDTGFTFHIDEDKVIFTSTEDGDRFRVAECGVNFKARDAQDLIAERTKHLAITDVKDSWLIGLLGFQVLTHSLT